MANACETCWLKYSPKGMRNTSRSLLCDGTSSKKCKYTPLELTKKLYSAGLKDNRSVENTLSQVLGMTMKEARMIVEEYHAKVFK